MAVTIQIRRDTLANWNLANPVLAQGELAENLDNGQLKLGDGIRTWSALPYYGTTTSGSVDHGILAGLSDDDHPQYLNISRGDARYYTETELDAGQLDNRYYTEVEVNTISGSLNTKINTKVSTADFDELTQDIIGTSLLGINIGISYNDTTGKTTISGTDVSKIAFVDSSQTMTGGWTFSTISPVFSISPLFNNNVIWLARNSSGGVEDCFWARASNNNTYLNYGSGGHFYLRNNSGVLQYDFTDTLADFQNSDITTTGNITAANINIFGGYATSASSEGVSTTTSTTWQQKVRLTTSTLVAGTYRIGWYFEWYYTNATRNFQAQVQIDDTTTIMSQVQEPEDAATTQSQPLSGFYTGTLTSGTHNIDLDYRSSNAADTAGIQRARLEFWRIS